MYPFEIKHDSVIAVFPDKVSFVQYIYPSMLTSFKMFQTIISD